MINSPKNNFLQGLKDGVPILLGYLSVSFAFGIVAVNDGLPVWAPILISLTNFTGTGQFIGSSQIAVGAALTEIAFTLLVVNARYILMSVSLSQKLAPNVGFWKRVAIAFGVTDEIFGVAMDRKHELTGTYFAGLILVSFCGWVGGTAIGAFAGSIIPASVLSAMGIALFAMFIAIIVPSARGSKAVTCVLFSAAAIAILFCYTPLLKKLDKSWVIILAGVLSAGICALIFPIKNAENPDLKLDSDSLPLIEIHTSECEIQNADREDKQ